MVTYKEIEYCASKMSFDQRQAYYGILLFIEGAKSPKLAGFLEKKIRETLTEQRLKPEVALLRKYSKYIQ